MANREDLVIIRGARAGDAAAQLALGKLYLSGQASLPQNLPSALHWLSRAASQGVDEAWQLIGSRIPDPVLRQAPAALPWLRRAAQAGVPGAAATLARLCADPAPAAPPAAAPAPVADGMSHGDLLARLERCWREQAPAAFLAQALPLARSLLAAHDGGQALTPPAATLLARCAQVLALDEGADQGELLSLRSAAAEAGDRDAQLALGLALARMQVDGERAVQAGGTVNFKRALRWLARAGEQGLADAWYAMSRIYNRPEFSQRSMSEAHACLEKAADMGHSGAQFECGIHAWRARRGDELNDVRAVYWLQKAAAQGCGEAQAALDRIAPPPPRAAWAEPLLPLVTRELLSAQPLLAARIELAAMFRLTRAEALLLDVKAADHGHCLVVDIRASYGRSKRRLVLVRNAHERRALDRIVHLFDELDASIEGNYRQRLYRFKAWLSEELLAA